MCASKLRQQQLSWLAEGKGWEGVPQQLTFMVDMTGASGRFVLHMQALSIGATFSTDMHSGIWSAAQRGV